jgi:hypothetical protein
MFFTDKKTGDLTNVNLEFAYIIKDNQKIYIKLKEKELQNGN